MSNQLDTSLQKVDTSLQTIKKGAILTVMLLGAFIAILNQTLMNVALPNMMKDLNVAANTAQWLATGYMLVNGVLIPTTAFLMERFTTRQLFLSAMGLFSIGTLTCGLAPNFSMLLVGRMIQASGAGILMPLLMMVILNLFPIEKRGRAMGFVGTALVFAPAIGPTLSGWIIQTHSWRMLFFIVLPIAFLAIIVGAFLLENVTEQSFPKIDVLAIIFSTLGFGGLLYGVSSAGDFGWFSPDVLVTLTVGIIALWLFIRRQMTAENPMLDLSVFKFNMYTLTSIISVIVTMAMFAGMVIVPIYMQTARDFTPIESGFLLFPGAIAMGIMSPINGWIFDKIGAKWLAIVGLTITAITTWELSGLTSSTSYTFLLILYTFRMFGMSMLMMPIMTAGLNQLPETLYSHGVAVSNTLRVISGALGTAFLVTVMTTRTEKYVQELTITAGADAQSKMSTIVSQASIQGINDAFTIATVLALLSLLLAFFIKHVEPAEE